MRGRRIGGGLPARGSAVRALGLPLPPGRMPALRRGRPLKRWRYVGVFAPELIACVGHARVAGIARRWWAVALPGGRLFEGDDGVRLEPGSARAGQGAIELALHEDERTAVEVVSPHGRAHIWTRKQAGLLVRGRVRVGGRDLSVDGPFGFVDDSAGYHARRTWWRWCAGIGRAAGGAAVAWNLVEGVHDAPEASERTVWVDGTPQEVSAQPFAPDLSRVGDLTLREWCAREERVNRIAMRSHYRQPFGSFVGMLPGGLALEEGYGVTEWHDVRW